MSDQNSQKILDNQSGSTVGDKLRHEIGEGSKLRFVSAFFTIYAYEKLQTQLEKISSLKFLFGSPSSVDDLDPNQKPKRAYELKEEGIKPSEALQQKFVARKCAEWIENNHVQIKTIKKENFMHGKMYHVEKPDGKTFSITGSSNFTSRGLGLARKGSNNYELNILSENSEICDNLVQWFEEIWKSNHLTSDAKKDVLESLNRMSQEYGPKFIYYKTLFHVFQNEIKAGLEGAALEKKHLYDTAIWNSLYPFQKHGVNGIINKLNTYNGCILADSVGLGKTYQALAVIKFFQNHAAQKSRIHKTLVLCPKKLEANWITHRFDQRSAPFPDDKFDFDVRAHTDLTAASQQNINWSQYDLVVIDESHNFRNETKHRKNEEGEVIRISRYQKLLDEVTKKAKVLMLSATPVNNSLSDLRSQIYLMTENQGERFSDILNRTEIKKVLAGAQKKFEKWQKEKGMDKEDLIDSLGSEFFTLLNATTIARGRKHVEKYYSDFIEQTGGFPKRKKAENKTPATDSEGSISYEELNNSIKNFKLAIYNPTSYLSHPEKVKEKSNFNQRDRERYLLGMMRVNFLKRLESSIEAFRQTLARTIDKIEKAEGEIENHLAAQQGAEIDITPDEDEEDEEYMVSQLRYPLSDLNCSKWQADLQEDRKLFQGILDKVKQVSPSRDAKLTELKKTILNKIKRPTKNKQGKVNKKVLIFTAFADTAKYIHEHLKRDVEGEGVHIAQLSGSAVNQTTLGRKDFSDILDNFSPLSRNRSNGIEEEIDVLIATDCISEGQNLQDCDMVINYDIHWNPVRLIQRFGRIDRIGSENELVQMINFWPTEEMEKYLKLKDRVKARMHLANIAATGVDNPLDETEQESEAKIKYRDDQLRKLWGEEIIELDEDVSLNDFTLSDFMADLFEYIQENKTKLEASPNGIYAIAEHKTDLLNSNTSEGAIFLLRQRNSTEEAKGSAAFHPYYIVAVDSDGTFRYSSITNAKRVLEYFRSIARDQENASQPLCDLFHEETQQGEDMGTYNKLMDVCLKHIKGAVEKKEMTSITENRTAKLTKASERPRDENDFELITWLIIKNSIK